MLRDLIITAVLIVIFSAVAHAVPTNKINGDVTWTNPVTRSDGTAFDPATEMAGVRIYADCGSGFALWIDVAGVVTAFTIVDAPLECQDWLVTVYDSDGRESQYSNAVHVKAPPGQISDFSK